MQTTRKPVKLLAMGLPRVGKTTFLAAFWHLLTSREVQDSLVLAELQPSRDHLNMIATLWRKWKEIPRTTLPKERVVTVNVRLPGQDQVFELAVPDASGEAFKRIFETRHCSREFEDLATESRELLLFLHPKQAVPPQRIDLEVDKLSEDLDKLLDEMAKVPDSAAEGTAGGGVSQPASAGGDEKQVATEETQTPTEILEWDAKYSAYQAKLVDLLQIASRLRGPQPARLAIVISAWDRCEKEKLQPEAWIKARLPLLYQYMVANADVCEFAVFGVSAQGAELKNPGVLLDTIRASDRIKVVHGANESKDLTLPIKFLLEDAAKDSAK
jgi:GTPase SAR1 family protein